MIYKKMTAGKIDDEKTDFKKIFDAKIRLKRILK